MNIQLSTNPHVGLTIPLESVLQYTPNDTDTDINHPEVKLFLGILDYAFRSRNTAFIQSYLEEGLPLPFDTLKPLLLSAEYNLPDIFQRLLQVIPTDRLVTQMGASGGLRINTLISKIFEENNFDEKTVNRRFQFLTMVRNSRLVSLVNFERLFYTFGRYCPLDIETFQVMLTFPQVTLHKRNLEGDFIVHESNPIFSIILQSGLTKNTQVLDRILARNNQDERNEMFYMTLEVMIRQNTSDVFFRTLLERLRRMGVTVSTENMNALLEHTVRGVFMNGMNMGKCSGLIDVFNLLLEWGVDIESLRKQRQNYVIAREILKYNRGHNAAVVDTANRILKSKNTKLKGDILSNIASFLTVPVVEKNTSLPPQVTRELAPIPPIKVRQPKRFGEKIAHHIPPNEAREIQDRVATQLAKAQPQASSSSPRITQKRSRSPSQSGGRRRGRGRGHRSHRR